MSHPASHRSLHSGDDAGLRAALTRHVERQVGLNLSPLPASAWLRLADVTYSRAGRGGLDTTNTSPVAAAAASAQGSEGASSVAAAGAEMTTGMRKLTALAADDPAGHVSGQVTALYVIDVSALMQVAAPEGVTHEQPREATTELLEDVTGNEQQSMHVDADAPDADADKAAADADTDADDNDGKTPLLTDFGGGSGGSSAPATVKLDVVQQPQQTPTIALRACRQGRSLLEPVVLNLHGMNMNMYPSLADLAAVMFVDNHMPVLCLSQHKRCMYVYMVTCPPRWQGCARKQGVLTVHTSHSSHV